MGSCGTQLAAAGVRAASGLSGGGGRAAAAAAGRPPRRPRPGARLADAGGRLEHQLPHEAGLLKGRLLRLCQGQGLEGEVGQVGREPPPDTRHWDALGSWASLQPAARAARLLGCRNPNGHDAGGVGIEGAVWGSSRRRRALQQRAQHGAQQALLPLAQRTIGTVAIQSQVPLVHPRIGSTLPAALQALCALLSPQPCPRGFPGSLRSSS